MNWLSVWAFIKDVPAKVWAGAAWALCILGWWITRSELAKQKAETIRLKRQVKTEQEHRGTLIRLQERKQRIAKELANVKSKARQSETQIIRLDDVRLAKELNDEFSDDN